MHFDAPFLVLHKLNHRLKAFSLYELNEYVKRVIALNFEEPLWIKCEISQLNETRGNYYLELIEKDEATGNVIAKSSAAIWYKSALFIKKKLGDLFHSVLQAGSEVKLKVQVEFHEQYGFKLVIEDIDAEYTIGQHELSKRKTYEKLQKEGVLNNNEELSLKSVNQNIAIVSSKRAAGLQDFIAQLENNQYGYMFGLSLFDSAVQGQKASAEIVSSLQLIEEHRDKYDCVVIIRGGGSKMDLAAFDSYDIAKQITQMSLPVISGIGHDIDNTITDIVSHTSLKTPTAVADFLIENLVDFESQVLTTFSQIEQLSKTIISKQRYDLDAAEQYLNTVLSKKVIAEQNKLSLAANQIKHLVNNTFSKQKSFLNMAEKVLHGYSFDKVLKRGFSYTTQEGNIITKKSDLALNKAITIHYFDGNINTKIDE